MPTFVRISVLATITCVLLISGRASADQVTLSADRDNTMYEEGNLSNGAGDHIFAGRTDQPYIRRALIRFNVAAAIPNGSVITGATLTLYCSRTKTQNENVALYRLLADWGEGTSDAPLEEGGGASATTGDATWLYRFYNTSLWGKPGGDFAVGSSATTVVGNQNAFYSWSSSGMVADAQGWLNTPTTNFGWLIIGDESAVKETKRFDSRTNPDLSHRPSLVLSFTPPATQTGACCASNGSCTLVVHPGTSCTGTYAGAGTTCSPNNCPQPTGACCLPSSGATCSALTQTACVTQGGSFQGALSSCSPNPCPLVLTPYLDALPRPAVATPTSGVPGGAASYEMAIVELSQKLHSSLPASRVWGLSDGTVSGYPGPTIEAASNQPISVTWKNDLRDANGVLRTQHYLTVDSCIQASSAPRTVIHLHGGHVPQAVDGYPEATFLPGESAVYPYPNRQDAATLWYHDHALGLTRLNVYMGIAGFYLIRSSEEQALGLPSGQYEIPLAIQDRSFHPDGTLAYPSAWAEHFFGDFILVNGKVWPYLDVDRGKYRFRVLNGSNARVYTLSLSNGAPFMQIGSEGGLLSAPVTLSETTIGPGERADLVIDFSSYAAGTEIILQNSATAPFPASPGVGVIPNVMKFRVTSQAGVTAAIPSSLRVITPLAESSAAVTRDFTLDKVSDPCTGSVWKINGLGWKDAISEKPKLGTNEIWRFINTSGVMHPMHMHLVMFQVLDRQAFDLVNGSVVPSGSPAPPAANEAGWKDTVKVNPKEIVRVIARFENYVGKYPFHCHTVEHEDNDMMRQFETTTVCGDGVTGEPLEQCDDGNTVGGDGCENDCTFTSGFGGSAGTGGNAGTGATTSHGGGLGGKDGGAKGGTDGGAATGGKKASSEDDGGCGCHTTGRGPSGQLALALGLLIWIWRRRR